MNLPGTASLDLVVLVPGKDEQVTMTTLLSKRRESLGIRNLTWQIIVHPRRDPGCFLEGPELLQPYINQARRAIVLLDRVGSGQERNLSAHAMEEDLAGRLARQGWKDRAAAVVVDPELEAWVWSDSPEVDAAFSWEADRPDLRGWLRSNGLLKPDAVKPEDPKRAMNLVCREVRLPRSSALFGKLASSVSLERCKDEAFRKLKTILCNWFTG